MNKFLARKKKKITVPRIAILGMFLALLITLKYAFGFVPGIEMVSFLFIIFGIFLPIFDLTLIIVAFNLLILVIYGFGNWWFAYWVIWPIDAFLSKGLSKVTKNRFIFAVFGFLIGASVGVWYFFSDLIFFGRAFAVLNIITAIPINVIEGFTTMFLIIFIAPLLVKVISTYSTKFWDNPKPFKFSEVKHPKLSIFISVFLGVGSIAGITTLFVYNHSFIEWKERESRTTPGHITDAPLKGYGSGKSILKASEYNKIFDSLTPDEIAVAVIANGVRYKEILKWHTGETLKEAMDSGPIKFRFHHDPTQGDWIMTFKPEVSSPSWLHGTATTQNYGDYYPVYFVNHHFASLGVGNWHVASKEIYEITYDHDA